MPSAAAWLIVTALALGAAAEAETPGEGPLANADASGDSEAVTLASPVATGSNEARASAEPPPEALATGPLSPRAPTGADTIANEQAHHFVVGAKGSYLARFADAEVHHVGGGGLFFEVSLVPEWLDLEYGVRAMSDGRALTFPIDVLLKLPIQLSEVAHPFVGVGPTVVPMFEEEASVEAGATAVLGSYLWLSSAVGLVFEASYSLLFEAELVHEVGGNVGAAYRF